MTLERAPRYSGQMPIRSHDDARALEALVALLEMDVGYAVDFFGLLSLRQLEDLRFVVCTRLPHPKTRKSAETEDLFTSAREAAAFFLRRRAELQLGYDFERVPPSPAEPE